MRRVVLKVPDVEHLVLDDPTAALLQVLYQMPDLFVAACCQTAIGTAADGFDPPAGVCNLCFILLAGRGGRQRSGTYVLLAESIYVDAQTDAVQMRAFRALHLLKSDVFNRGARAAHEDRSIRPHFLGGQR